MTEQAPKRSRLSRRAKADGDDYVATVIIVIVALIVLGGAWAAGGFILCIKIIGLLLMFAAIRYAVVKAYNKGRKPIHRQSEDDAPSDKADQSKHVIQIPRKRPPLWQRSSEPKSADNLMLNYLLLLLALCIAGAGGYGLRRIGGDWGGPYRLVPVTILIFALTFWVIYRAKRGSTGNRDQSHDTDEKHK